MNKEEFEKALLRHKTLQEYPQAFRLCLDSLSDANLVDTASEAARDLIKTYSYDVMEEGKNYNLTGLLLDIDINWILDTAIAEGYKSVTKEKMSTSIFSSVPCITIGNMLTRQKFGINENKKDGSKTFLYSKSGFTSDYKLVKALLNDIVVKLTVKYHGFDRIKGYLPAPED